MSTKIISVKIENDGTILWDRYTPDHLNIVLCPKRDKPCNIFCPLVMINADGEHLLFSCGGTNMSYKIESFIRQNTEEEYHD